MRRVASISLELPGGGSPLENKVISAFIFAILPIIALCAKDLRKSTDTTWYF